MADSSDHKTIMFADVVNSTGLYERLGDVEARRVLAECMDIMEAIVRDMGGTPIKRIGDEVLSRFDKPDHAALAARQIHERIVMAAATGALPETMRMRIGFAHGPVILHEKDVFGTTVHTAARVAALAKAHQTLTTKETLEELDPDPSREDRFVVREVLRGQAREQDIHELVWDASATFVPTRIVPRKTTASGLQAVELSYEGNMVRVDAARPRIDLGRDPACALQVKGFAVSRLHARVIWSRGKVKIEDISSNATCVNPDGGSRRTIHRELALLQGRGILTLGCNGPEEEAAVVQYRCIEAE